MANYSGTKSQSNYKKHDVKRTPSTLEKYVTYNTPIIGNLKRASDDINYFNDYERNHNVNVAYPGRVYGNYLKGAYHETVSAVGRGSRLLSRWL